MTPTITPEALEHAVQAYARAQDMGHNHHDALYSALTSALPEKAASTISGVPDAWANPDNPDDVVSASKLDSLRHQYGAPGKKLAERYTKALYAAQPQAEQDRASETSRRQAAVAHMLGEGWRWDGAQWCREPENVESMRQQSVAWLAVTEAIARLVPDWLSMGDTGIERAVAAIEFLAARHPRAEQQGAGDALVEAARWHREINLAGFQGDDWRAEQMLKCPHGRFATAIEDALAARQPVGEPVGEVFWDNEAGEISVNWLNGDLPPGIGTLLYDAPPAAVDLGNYMAILRDVLRTLGPEDHELREKITALIDSKAVRNG
ncbi:hypothetical protein NG831_06320 [Xanthomonas sacchari]|uniref:hypothetical protein n=1 Tax=Xanthomonas sacchari TaxID=56458 RepID=UPI00224E5093|nr:hypothetical protein [Xanthomonas sacchari]MCW0413521.1 hypothetical protein [Xanthomonas sacchari]UYK67774.1 hypothetical protein NG831_06320 [Xanthomonas sacchari]